MADDLKEKRWYPKRSHFAVTFRSQLMPSDVEEQLDAWATVISGEVDEITEAASAERVSNWQAHLNERKREQAYLQKVAKHAGGMLNSFDRYDHYLEYAEQRGFSPEHIQAQLVLMFGDELSSMQETREETEDE